MIIVKHTHHDRFAITPKEIFEDQTLTWGAKAMLAWITSHSEGYQLHINTIIKYSKEKRDYVYARCKELTDQGYLFKHQPRLPDGRLGAVHYLASQEPQTQEHWQTLVDATDWLEVEGYEPKLSTGKPTASGFTVSGSAASGESDTKNTITKNTKKILRNTSTTAPAKLPQKKMKIPDINQVTQYFAFKQNDAGMAQDFFDFYESKGWVVGKSPMKKWESAACRWMRSPFNNQPTQKSSMELLLDRDWAKDLVQPEVHTTELTPSEMNALNDTFKQPQLTLDSLNGTLEPA